MEENFYYIELFEIYKDLLTDKQKDIFSMHFLLDLSLSEIAEEKEITRQNVSDTIKNAKEKLSEYESILKISKKNKELTELSSKLDKDSAQKILDIVGR